MEMDEELLNETGEEETPAKDLAEFEARELGIEPAHGDIPATGVSATLPIGTLCLAVNGNQNGDGSTTNLTKTAPSYTTEALAFNLIPCKFCELMEQDHDFAACMLQVSTSDGQDDGMDRIREVLYFRKMASFFDPLFSYENKRHIHFHVLARTAKVSALYPLPLTRKGCVKRLGKTGVTHGPSADVSIRTGGQVEGAVTVELSIPLFIQDAGPNDKQNVIRKFDKADWEKYQHWITRYFDNSKRKWIDHQPETAYVEPSRELMFPNMEIWRDFPETDPEFRVFMKDTATAVDTGNNTAANITATHSSNTKALAAPKAVDTATTISSEADVTIGESVTNFVADTIATNTAPSTSRVSQIPMPSTGRAANFTSIGFGSPEPFSLDYNEDMDVEDDQANWSDAKRFDFASRAQDAALAANETAANVEPNTASSSKTITAEKSFKSPALPTKIPTKPARVWKGIDSWAEHRREEGRARSRSSTRPKSYLSDKQPAHRVSETLTAFQQATTFLNERRVNFNIRRSDEGQEIINNLLDKDGRVMTIITISDPAGPNGSSLVTMLEHAGIINDSNRGGHITMSSAEFAERTSNQTAQRLRSLAADAFGSSNNPASSSGLSSDAFNRGRQSRAPLRESTPVKRYRLNDSVNTDTGEDGVTEQQYVEQKIFERRGDRRTLTENEYDAIARDAKFTYAESYDKHGRFIDRSKARDSRMRSVSRIREPSRQSRRANRLANVSPKRRYPTLGRGKGNDFVNRDPRIKVALNMPSCFRKQDKTLWDLRQERQRSGESEAYTPGEEPHTDEWFFSNGKPNPHGDVDLVYERFREFCVSEQCTGEVVKWWSLGDHPISATRETAFIKITVGDDVGKRITPCLWYVNGILKLHLRTNPELRLWPTVSNTCSSFPGPYFYREALTKEERYSKIFRCQICNWTNHDSENCPLSIWDRRTLLRLINHCYVCLQDMGEGEKAAREHVCKDPTGVCFYCKLYGHNQVICGSANHLKHLLRPNIYFGIEQKCEADSYTIQKNGLTAQTVQRLRGMYRTGDIDFHCKFIRAIGTFDGQREECYRSSAAVVTEYDLESVDGDQLGAPYAFSVYGDRLQYLLALKKLNVDYWTERTPVAPVGDWEEDKAYESLI